MKRLAILAGAALALFGCNAVSRGSRLSDVPLTSNQLFMSTGGAPTRFRTLGFVQIRGYGVEVAGYADVGDAQLDGAIKGYLAQEARRLGGNGVINIEFVDENPSTEVERAGALYNSFSNRGLQTKERYVTVTGEVVQLLE